MLQRFLSELFKRDIGWSNSRTAAMGKTRKKCLFWGLFVHAAVRSGTCACTLKIVNTLIKNSSRDDLDIESTHGQPASLRTRPVNLDDGLKYIRWIRGLGSEKFPRHPTFFSQTWKIYIYIAIGEGSTFLSPVFYTAAPWCVCTRRLAGARHVSPAVLWTLWPEGRSEPLTSAPRLDFKAQSLAFSIDVCRALGISPVWINIWLSFSQADLGPTSAQKLFFSGLEKKLKLFFRRFVLIASGTEIFSGYLWNSNFFW